MYAVEKNPCAVVALQAQVREVWRDRDVTVIAGDMRRVKMPEKADIIVSELLGKYYYGSSSSFIAVGNGSDFVLKSGARLYSWRSDEVPLITKLIGKILCA